ncbi:MFS transporter [Rothia uropygialis]|uniref:MFS transporter n=1 Tax=Kocuria sp. 36 TaxID=1415402 RepID=UPI001EE7F345|nr:MFS transporter [Kocuria sp. 36]
MSSTPPTGPVDNEWLGYTRGTPEFTRMLVAMFCAGVATFAPLYSPQAVLPSIASDLNRDVASVALIVSAATLGLALFALPWTYVADRWGKNRTMAIAIITATLLGLLIPWVPHFGMLLFFRFVQGAALAGLAGVAVAFITEETQPLHAGAATGLYVSGTTIGGLAGRLISGPVAQFTDNWRIAIVSVAVLATAAAVAFLILLPKARRFTPVPASGAIRTTLGRIGGHLRSPGMVSLFLLAFTLMGAFVTVYNYVGFKLELPPYSLSEVAISLLFLAYLSGTFTSSVAGRLAARFGRLTTILMSMFVMIAGVLLTTTAPLVLVVIGLVLLTMGFFAAHSAASAWTGLLAGDGKAQGTAMYNLFYYAGSAVVGWAGGFFYIAGGWILTGWFCIAVVAFGALFSGVVLRGQKTAKVERIEGE